MSKKFEKLIDRRLEDLKVDVVLKDRILKKLEDKKAKTSVYFRPNPESEWTGLYLPI